MLFNANEKYFTIFGSCKYQQLFSQGYIVWFLGFFLFYLISSIYFNTCLLLMC